jgi:hypothetical protein
VVSKKNEEAERYHEFGSPASLVSVLTEDRNAMTVLRLYEKLRLYQPLGCLFQPDVNMPPGATTETPACLLCHHRSRLPPAKVGWIDAGEKTRLFLVCGDCGLDHSDAEIERRVVEKVSEPVAVAAE